jgi:hypothetical protein
MGGTEPARTVGGEIEVCRVVISPLAATAASDRSGASASSASTAKVSTCSCSAVRSNVGFRATWSCYEPTVAADRNARSSPLITRVCPVTVKVALARRSLELLPALSSTGPGSMTSSPERPV